LVPESVDLICPHCEYVSSLKTGNAVYDPVTKIATMPGTCVRCGEKSVIFVIEPSSVQEQPTCKEIWSYPPAPKPKQIIFTEEQIPVRIFMAYRTSVEAFNQKNWRSSVTECGRVLEGIGKKSFPSSTHEKRTLGALLKALTDRLKETPDYLILLKPILDLGDVFRIGRNTSAHFDLEKEVDRNVAEKILDLTEFLIRYFYTLSGESASLDSQIKDLNPGDSLEELEN
jgi:hypothetical protein